MSLAKLIFFSALQPKQKPNKAYLAMAVKKTQELDAQFGAYRTRMRTWAV